MSNFLGTLTSKLRGWPTAKLGRSPESSITAGREENAYRPVPLECHVRAGNRDTGETATQPQRHFTPRNAKPPRTKKPAEAAPLACQCWRCHPAKTAVVARGCGATLPGKREATTNKKPAEATALARHHRRARRAKTERWPRRAAVLAVAGMFPVGENPNDA